MKSRVQLGKGKALSPMQAIHKTIHLLRITHVLETLGDRVINYGIIENNA